MAAEIAKKANGEAAFAYHAGHPKPWHGEGVPYSAPHDVASCVWESGHHARDVVRQAHAPNGEPLAMWYCGPASDPTTVYGAVTPRFRPMQPEGMWTDARALLEQGWVPVSSGKLGNGAKSFVCFAPPPEHAETSIGDGDDKVRRYLTLANANDGKTAYRGLYTATRVVCQNTLSAALAERQGVFSMRHNASLDDQRAAFRRAIEAGDAGLDATCRLLADLGRVPCSIDAQKRFISKLFKLDSIAASNAKSKRKALDRAVVQAVATQASVPALAFTLDDIAEATIPLVAELGNEAERQAYALQGGLDAIASRSGDLSAARDAVEESQSRILRRVLDMVQCDKLVGGDNLHALVQGIGEYVTHCRGKEGPDGASRRLDATLFGDSLGLITSAIVGAAELGGLDVAAYRVASL